MQDWQLPLDDPTRPPLRELTAGPILETECGCCYRHHAGVRTVKEGGARAWVCDHCRRMDRLDVYPHSAP